MDYFTADLHIGHDKDFLYKPRGFSSIEEHDTAIIERWNKIISQEDNVYILGDLCMSSNEYEWDRVLRSLNGNIYFLHGNHDTDNKILKYCQEYKLKYLGPVSIYKYTKKKKFYLSHYPTLVGNYDNRFFYNLSGHTHSKDKFQYMQFGVYNVALDAHDCFPVSIEQIIEDIKKGENK